MALIYRVEHKDQGIGPYNGSGRVPGLGPAHSKDGSRGSESHPTPYWDGIDYQEPGQYCGFDSFEKFKTWFAGWLWQLHDHGHVLRVYEVDEDYVRRGRKQVLFERDRARLVHEQSVIGKEKQWQTT